MRRQKSSQRQPTIAELVRQLTGIDLSAVRRFLRDEAYRRGEGFYSHYPGQGAVSCTSTAICSYALSETQRLKPAERRGFLDALLAFRSKTKTDSGRAFPRTTDLQPSTWATGQAVLAMLSLGAEWPLIEPSVDWLIHAQAPSGGWNFGGDDSGDEKLVYTVYPTLVLLRCRAAGHSASDQALSGVHRFLGEHGVRDDPFWIPCDCFLRARLSGNVRAQDSAALAEYAALLRTGWPSEPVNEDQLAIRFSMSMFSPANLLFLRALVLPTDPIALLHVRYLADETINGRSWTDAKERRPKTWATALGLLALYRWAADLLRSGRSLQRLPTQMELFRASTRSSSAPAELSGEARALRERIRRLQPGDKDANRYRDWVRDVLVFLFAPALGEPRTEPRTWLGTLRRDVTFAIRTNEGPWQDWKDRHELPGSVVVECKNKSKLGPDDLRQTACYLGSKMGRFAILATRDTSIDQVRPWLNWFANNDDKYILVVSDRDLIAWIELKETGGDPGSALYDCYRSLRESVQ